MYPTLFSKYLVKNALEGAQAAQMQQVIDSLHERERDILLMAIGHGCEQKSVSEISEVLFLTRERTQELLNRAMLKIRKNPDAKFVWESVNEEALLAEVKRELIERRRKGEDLYLKDVSDYDITAQCVKNYDPLRREIIPELTPGETYNVTHIRMLSDFTFIYLKGRECSYNSVNFKFFRNGEPHELYQDEHCMSDGIIFRDAVMRWRYDNEKDEGE